MKQILLITLLAATTIVASAQTVTKAKSGADAKAETEIKQMADAYAKAMKNLNVDALASMLTENTMVSDNNGALGDKAKYLAALRARVGQGQYDDYHFEDIVIHLYGNAAVINLIVVSKGSSKNGPFNSRSRGTGTFVKQKGQWLVASIHTSSIKQP
jgi:ketosteroid isomerase-like protein